MRKLIVVLFLCFLICPIVSMASVYGVLKGKVTDTQGKALKGASVRIEGTTLGTFVKEADGSYIVVSIPTGTYVIRYSFTGMQTVRKQVSISADQTIVLDIKLGDSVLQTKVLDVIADKMVDNASVGSLKNLGKDKIQGTAREGIAAVIATQAGVIQSGGGFSVRGSRPEETQMLVDGQNVSNQFVGGFGTSGSYYYPMVSSFALESSQIITGGFQAEYGDA